MSKGLLILDEAQLEQKVRRIAYEVYERNHTEKEIVFAGIYRKGYRFAEMLKNEFDKVANIQSRLVKITLDKRAPLQSDIVLDCEVEEMADKTIVLVDDVLSTGRTLAFSLKPFLNVAIAKLEVAVVVDRNHSQFPMKANYVGYSLSTTLQDHVHVELFEQGSIGVYLK